MLHRRLLHEATQFGAEKILQQLPADLRPGMEQCVHEAVHEAVFHYAAGMETLSRQIRPLDHLKSRSSITEIAEPGPEPSSEPAREEPAGQVLGR